MGALRKKEFYVHSHPTTLLCESAPRRVTTSARKELYHHDIAPPASIHTYKEWHASLHTGNVAAQSTRVRVLRHFAGPSPNPDNPEGGRIRKRSSGYVVTAAHCLPILGKISKRGNRYLRVSRNPAQHGPLNEFLGLSLQDTRPV
jgi:hypothetical protein